MRNLFSASKAISALLLTLFAIPSLATPNEGLKPTEMLNQRRTQVTLMLYAPILAEMLDHGSQDIDSWFTKLRQKLDKDFNAQQVFAHRRQCLTQLLGAWHERSMSGRYSSSGELLEALFAEGKKVSPDCIGWLTSIAGKDARAEVHGGFLQSLMLAEQAFSLAEQKETHIKALPYLLTGASAQYPRAAQELALFYAEDADVEIANKAKLFYKAIPMTMRIRSVADFVRPDTLVLPVTGTIGAIRLIDRLAVVAPHIVGKPAKVKGAAISLGLHLGLLATANASGKDEGRKHSLGKLEHKSKNESLNDWLPNITTDPLPRALVMKYAVAKNRRYLGMGDSDFDLLPFFVMIEGNKDLELHNPLLLEAKISELRSLSALVRTELLDKSVPFLKRVDRARKQVFKSGIMTKYVRDQASFLPFVNFKGGNCVTQTQLMLALFYPHRDLLVDGWAFAFETMPYHIQPTLLRATSGENIDLVTGRKNRFVKNAFFHPAAYFEGYLRTVRSAEKRKDSTPWEKYILAKPSRSLLSAARNMMGQLGGRGGTLSGYGGSSGVMELPPHYSDEDVKRPEVPARATMTFAEMAEWPEKKEGHQESRQDGGGQGSGMDGGSDADRGGDIGGGFSLDRLFGGDSSLGGLFGARGRTKGRGGNGTGNKSGWGTILAEDSPYGDLLQTDYSGGTDSSEFKSKLISPRDLNQHKGYENWKAEQLSPFSIGRSTGSYLPDGTSSLGEYELLLKSDADRDKLESIHTDAGRAAYLEKILEREIAEQENAMAKVLAVLKNPLDPWHKEDSNRMQPYRLLQSAFGLDELVSRFLVIERIRTRRGSSIHNFGEDMFKHRAELERFERAVLSNARLRQLLARQMAVLNALTNEPEVLLKIKDHEAVPAVNKDLVMNMMMSTYNRHSIFTVVGAKPFVEEPWMRTSAFYRLYLASANPRKAIANALSEPNWIGISEKKNEIEPTPPSLEMFSPPSEQVSPFQVSDPKPPKKKSETAACPESDKSGRCREQNIVWVNTVAAKVYVSPATFIETYFTLLQGMQNDRDLPLKKRLLTRWDRALETLFLRDVSARLQQNLAGVYTTGGVWHEGMMKSLEERYPESSQHVRVKFIRGRSTSDASGKVTETKEEYFIRTSSRLAGYKICREAAQKAADEIRKKPIQGVHYIDGKINMQLVLSIYGPSLRTEIQCVDALIKAEEQPKSQGIVPDFLQLKLKTEKNLRMDKSINLESFRKQ